MHNLWILTPNILTANKWVIIKQNRDDLLNKSDWTQLQDAVLTPAEQIVWLEYRQALRDIPQDFINPDDVIFPTRPQ